MNERVRQAAQAALHQGKLAEALKLYEELAATGQALPEDRFNQAWLLRRTGKPADALTCYEQALSLGIDHPADVLLNMASILSHELHRLTEAKATLNKILDENPQHTAALINLGNLYEDEGDREHAEANYRRALSVGGNTPLALARLAGVMTITSANDPIITQLQDALSAQALAPLDRADLGFALGRALDAVGQYRDAFSAYSAANKNLATSYGPKRRRYNRQSFDKLIDTLISQPTQDNLQEENGRGLIFICGAYRSGSTLTEQIIGGHPDVVTGGELNLMPRAMSQFSATPLNIHSLSTDLRERIGQAYQQAAVSLFGPYRYLTDKKPDNILLVAAVKSVLPGAKIVITRRDQRDNALSLYFTALGPELPYAQDLGDILHYLSALDRLSQHWATRFPDDVSLFRYEDLIRDPAESVRRLLEQLGLSFHEDCLEFFKRRNQVQTASVWQVRQPLYSSSVHRWKNYEDQFADVLRP